MTLIWLHVEKQHGSKIANPAWYISHCVPTLPVYLAFPSLPARPGFRPARTAHALPTTACFALFAVCVKRFGIDLVKRRHPIHRPIRHRRQPGVGPASAHIVGSAVGHHDLMKPAKCRDCPSVYMEQQSSSVWQ